MIYTVPKTDPKRCPAARVNINFPGRESAARKQYRLIYMRTVTA